MNVIVKLEQILDPVTGGTAERPWKKQIFITKTIENYPKVIAFQAWNTVADSLDDTPIGTTLDITFSLESKAPNGKYYTEAKILSAVKVG